MAIAIAIGAGWTYTAGPGVILTAPSGRSCYFQPGDDSAAFYETVDALDEHDDGPARDRLIDLAFGPYFD